MTKKETVALFGLIAALFPRDEHFRKPDPIMRDAWAEMLEDLPFDSVKAAIKATSSFSPFPPSIAEIRDYATRTKENRRKTAEEAWGIASEMIRKYGTQTELIAEEKPAEYSDVVVETRTYRCVKQQPSNKRYTAEKHCDPEVWGLLKRMGYKEICESDNPDVVRGQFMKAWNSHETEAKEYRVAGNILPNLFGPNGIPGGILNLLDNGENGDI